MPRRRSVSTRKKKPSALKKKQEDGESSSNEEQTTTLTSESDSESTSSKLEEQAPSRLSNDKEEEKQSTSLKEVSSSSPSSNNHQQSSSTTEPSSPGSNNTTTINCSPSNLEITTIDNNSQDVLVKTRATPRRSSTRKALKLSPSSPPPPELEVIKNDENPTSSSNDNSVQIGEESKPSDDVASNKMEDDDDFLTRRSSENVIDDDSDEVCETPKKSRTKTRRRPSTSIQQQTPKNSSTRSNQDDDGREESLTKVVPSASSSNNQMDTTSDDTTTSTDENPSKSSNDIPALSTPTRGRSVKRKQNCSSSSESEDSAGSDSSSNNRGKSKQRKLDSRPQRRRGDTTPISQRNTIPTTPLPSPGLARPRKLDVSKKLLVLHASDLKNVSSLKKKVTNAINDAKKSSTRASPKRPDSDVSRLSGNVTDADLKLLTDETISTGTVTLIDSTSQTNKRAFRDPEEFDEFKEFKDNVLIQIQIPHFSVVEEEPKGPSFTRTSEFIKYEIAERYDHSTLMLNPIPPNAEFDIFSHRKIDISLEYDMESDDEEWLKNYNKYSRYPLKEKEFEIILSLMNRASKNGKSCWFSVSSVLELSRFFGVTLDEQHVVQVKKLWESKYNPEKKLFKDEEIQKRIEIQNFLDEYVRLRGQLYGFKSDLEECVENSSTKKDLIEKHMKQMKRKNYSLSKEFSKFAQKFSSHDLDTEDSNSNNLDNDEELTKLEEEILKSASIADQIEISYFSKKEEDERREEEKKKNQKIRKFRKKKGGSDDNQDCTSDSNSPSSPTSSLASLIVPPLPPIITKNLSNIRTPESKTPTTLDTPTSVSEDHPSSKRRTRKKRLDSGTPTSNPSRTPTSASSDFPSFEILPPSLEPTSPISENVPLILDTQSPIPSPNMRRKTKRSKIILN